MKYKIVLIVFISFLSIFLLSVPKVLAGTIKAGVLDIEYSDAPAPLFNATNLYPGYTETKSLTVKNNGALPHSFSVAVSGDLGTLANVLIIEPTVLGNVVWSKTISQIAKHPESNVIIGLIAPGGSASVDITATLPETVGNEYQDKSTLAFNFIVGNESTDQKESSDQDQSNQQNVVQRTINRIRTAFRGNDTVNNFEDNNQNDQIQNNGTVSGASTEGESLGEQTDNKPICFWWWLFSIVLALFLIVYGYFIRKSEIVFAWIWPIYTGSILYAVHWILHQYYIPSRWCPYFVIFEIILLIAYYLSKKYLSKGKSGEE